MSEKLFFGKYRGKVAGNFDPLKQGRLQVTVPAITGNVKNWAMPCVPYAGPRVGLVLLPPNGANVWIEFEGGNIDYPIWTGCFWGTGEFPMEALTADVKLLKMDSITVKLSELKGAGGVTVEAKPPAVSNPITMKLDSQGVSLSYSAAGFEMNPSGLEIKNGNRSVKLTAVSVSINNGMLEVM